MSLAIGTAAPDFTLKDQAGNDVTLSTFRGQPVVVSFYPFAFSGLCTDEMCTVRDDEAMFAAAGVQVLAISCDSIYTLDAWAKARNFPYPMLSDHWPHGEVARAYGVFDEAAGCTNRCSFVIDAKGTIVAVLETPNRGVVRTHEDYEAALARLR